MESSRNIGEVVLLPGLSSYEINRPALGQIIFGGGTPGNRSSSNLRRVRIKTIITLFKGAAMGRDPIEIFIIAGGVLEAISLVFDAFGEDLLKIS